MSLVGNLEDLSLPDILQIVSLSKKSGVLTIEKEGLQGRIFIRDGRVIQTISPRPGKTLGEILSAKGMVGADDLKKALEIQRSGEKKELLGAILVRQDIVAQEALEKVVQEQIEESIVYFLCWKEGTFSFELSDIEARGEVSVDPHAFILEKGIDTQWLVLEGTRLMDERSREGPKAEDTVDDGITEEPDTSGAPESLGSIVLVDDNPLFRERAGEKLERLGYRVVPCQGTEEGLKAVRESVTQTPPIVVTGVVFPTSDGRGFLGGLELIEKLKSLQPQIPIVAVTAYPDDNVKAKMTEHGVSHFLIKPSGPEGEQEGAQKAFYDRLASSLAAVRGGAPPLAAKKEDAAESTEREKIVEAIDEKKAALAEQESSISDAGLDRDEMTLLQDMMHELQNPRATSEIGLLILRFAAEMLNRAVLFVIKGGNAVGLGGFGVDVSGTGRKGGVRGITIPLAEESLFGEVVSRRSAFRGSVPHTRWNLYLMEQLGGQTPTEAIAIPLVATGKVRVVLYGDNLPDSQPLPKMQALEIFLAQAGLTLERVLLEKKLQEGAKKEAAG